MTLRLRRSQMFIEIGLRKIDRFEETHVMLSLQNCIVNHWSYKYFAPSGASSQNSLFNKRADLELPAVRNHADRALLSGRHYLRTAATPAVDDLRMRMTEN